MTNPMIIVVGAGPGLGASVARRFGSEGYDVALIARSEDTLDTLGTELQDAGITTGWSAVDITDGVAFAAAIRQFGEQSGHIDVLHFNPSAFRHKDPLQLSVEELLDDVRLGVGALLTAVQAAKPFMKPGARLTVTGSLAADEPWNEAASLGVQKAGVRNLVRSIDATLKPDGVRAASVTVRGTLAPNTRFAPDLVAGAIFEASKQTEDSWRTEIPYTGEQTV
jgi:NADP-dependent 3-hydroxy acid dehydrogenase YdfG